MDWPLEYCPNTETYLVPGLPGFNMLLVDDDTAIIGPGEDLRQALVGLVLDRRVGELADGDTFSIDGQPLYRRSGCTVVAI